MKVIGWVLGCALAFGQTTPSVEVSQAAVDEDGIPTAPASVCLISNATRQCYTPPKHVPPFGLRAEGKLVALRQGLDGVLFKADSWAGGSGILTVLAVLVGREGQLVDLLPDVAITNQSEYRIWNEPSISDTALVVTADYVWGEGESHFGRHRYRVTTYAFSKELQSYILRDEYLTLKKYPGYDQSSAIDVLDPEKHEILVRLAHHQR